MKPNTSNTVQQVDSKLIIVELEKMPGYVFVACPKDKEKSIFYIGQDKDVANKLCKAWNEYSQLQEENKALTTQLAQTGELLNSANANNKELREALEFIKKMTNAPAIRIKIIEALNNTNQK